jgi:hypothetical protein
MKTLAKSLALGAAALGLFGGAAIAEDATTVLAPPTFRCKACGAQYQVKTKVMKDDTIQVKLEQIAPVSQTKKR